MANRIGCIAVLCSGYLTATMAQADTIKNSVRIPADNVSIDSMKTKTAASIGSIDQDLMNMVSQLMYGRTAGQVIDELVYTYGNGTQSTNSLANIAQLLSQQLAYLSLGIESAQAIINVLPPTSPHLIAAKLMINELSAFSTCIQTILAGIQQNAQPAAAPASTTTTATNAAPASDAALASTAVTLLTDVASAVATANTAPASNAPSSTSNATSTTTTHHHGSHAGW